MDIDSDGYVDILSGSYSRQGSSMAGLFHVLWGKAEGGFEQAEVLEGSDTQPLVLPMGEGSDGILRRICTRAFAVDLDGDDHLDLVSGNFEGSFWIFQGKGGGEFEPQATQLMLNEKPLLVDQHSDPFFCDWDGDGDQDLLSGSVRGGVELFVNVGDAKNASFAKPIVLVEKAEESKHTMLGNAHVTSAQGSTRVTAADVNGDGKLDLLVGDTKHLRFAKEGLDEAEVSAKVKELDLERLAYIEANADFDYQAATKEEQQANRDFWNQHHERLAQYVDGKGSGNVWLYVQQ